MQHLQAIADPTRAHILEMLAAQGSMTAGEIVARFTMSAPAISQHLKVLKEAGLVTVEVKAQSRIYRLNPEGLAVIKAWLDELTHVWTEKFDALEQVLKQDTSEI